MRFHTRAALGLAMAMFGCAPLSRSGDDASPADLRKLAEVRQSVREKDPGAIVGIITQALPDAPFVAVGDVPVEHFRVGETVTLIDSQQRVICRGAVRRITANAVHVEYDQPIGSTREPRVGDLVVRYSR